MLVFLFHLTSGWVCCRALWLITHQLSNDPQSHATVTRRLINRRFWVVLAWSGLIAIQQFVSALGTQNLQETIPEPWVDGQKTLAPALALRLLGVLLAFGWTWPPHWRIRVRNTDTSDERTLDVHFETTQGVEDP
eukprot:GABV01002258.1.p1 GENE.GABV01002258.1~~GABV01002258.1.p1  ORF type:complete len:135 (-),score=24.84 GABV01002258.1:23-427(-)